MSKQKFEHFKLSVKILKCLLRIIQRFHIRHQSLSIYYTRSSQDGLALLMLSGKSFRARQRKKKNMHRDVSKKYLSGAKSRIPMSC